MSSYGRSPTKTHDAGSDTPTAAIAARNASGCGLVHGISLLYTAPSIRLSTPSRPNTDSCALRGHMVLDSTPVLTPRARRWRSNGAASGSVYVWGSHTR